MASSSSYQPSSPLGKRMHQERRQDPNLSPEKKRPFVKQENNREMMLYDVHHLGIVAMLSEGNYDIVNKVLKKEVILASGAMGQRFEAVRGKKLLWRNNSFWWLYNAAGDYATVLRKARLMPYLDGWTVLNGGKVPLDTILNVSDINEFVLAMDNSDGDNFAPETITKDATPVDQLIQRATNTDGEQQGW